MLCSSRWLAPLLGLGLLLTARPLAAQKTQDEAVWTTFHKTPALALAPRFATYSVDYDLGSMVLNAPSRPALQGLSWQKDGGELLLRITAKSVFVTSRKLHENTTRNGVYSCYYDLGYSVEAGYELRDVKADAGLASYRRNSGSTATRSFAALADLNGYVANAFVGEKTRQLLDEMNQRADFALNPHEYPVAVPLASIEATRPEYAALNQATADLKALLAAAPNAAPDRAKVAALAAAWQQQVAHINWDEKKSSINKKVANALLKNLCATAMLTEDYAHLGEYAANFAQHNKGFFDSSPPDFTTTGAYGGSVSQGSSSVYVGHQTETRQRVYYDELAADVLPAQR